MPAPFVLPPQLAELDARAEHLTTPCGDGVMAWRAWGQGEPLVLVHGGHGSWLHWHRNIAGLAPHRRLLVPDLPGYGNSDVLLPIEDVDAHARVLAEGIRQLVGPGRPVDVVTFSAGTLVVARMDALVPDVVRRLVMIGAGGLGTPWFVPEFVPVRGLKGEAMREANRRNLAMFMVRNASRIDDGTIAMNMFGAPRMRSRTAHQVVPDRLLKAMAEVRTPVDLIWGEFDFPHPGPELHLGVIRQFQPGAQLRVMMGSGHWAMGEQPGQFNAALLELLDQPARPRLAADPGPAGVGAAVAAQ